MLLGTDLTKADSDGDGLPDGFEALTLGTAPLKADSDGNGVNDSLEDLDGDGLTNLQEYNLGTNPNNADSDGDGLTDGEEVNTYNTDPMNVDTDGDGLSDYNEVIKGFDPNVLNDSFNVTESYESEKVTPTVSIDNLSGEQVESLTIEPVTKYMLLDERIPGYIDSAFDFSVSGTFEIATISFEFDPTLLDDESFVPRIYYFNEEKQLLEELPDQTVEGNVVSVQTTHFSKYILLNKTEFDVVWENEILPPVNESGYSGMDVALIIDASFNMASSDPKNVRTNVAKAFIDNLGENDRGAVGIFDYLGIFIQDFTSNHEELYSALEIVGPFYAACNLSEGINLAYQYFTRDSYTRTDAYKAVILLTDGNGSYTETAYTNLAAENGITIYTIGLGSNVNSTVLKEIAQTTGGNYYFASTTNSLPGIYRDIENKANLSNIDKDSNNDGISDYYTQLICEGKIVSGTGQNYFEGIDYNSFQANNDYDGDGLKNGEEVTIVRCLDGKVYVKFNSNPCLSDSDEDKLSDNNDPYPLSFNTWINYDRDAVVNYCNTFHTIPNPLYGYFIRGDCANFASQCVHAGGLPMNDEWYFEKNIIIDLNAIYSLPLEVIYTACYLLNENANYSRAWTVAYDNYEYFSGNKNVSFGEVLEFNSKVEMQDAIANGNYNIQAGDLMYMQWEECPSHATIIDDVDYINNTLKYSAHTEPRNKKDVIESFWNSSPNGKLYVVRVKDVIITS